MLTRSMFDGGAYTRAAESMTSVCVAVSRRRGCGVGNEGVKRRIEMCW